METIQTNILNQFAVNYKHIIIDEIALEGLEGISVDLLWRRLRKCLSAEVTDKMKARYWSYIVNCGKVSVYELPEPLPHVQILDRFEIVDENTGHMKEPDCYFDGPYEYRPIEGEYGSCKYYETRKLIPTAVLKSKPYAAIISEYGDTLALVANKEDRWRALAPHMPISYLAQMTSVHYCMLELIGKSRSNGQSTVGLTNLSKIIKDPKALFYTRKYLRGLDLIGSRNFTMIIAGRGVKTLLVRLKRFNQPSVLTMPKVGVLHNVIEYLMEKPDYSEKIEVILKKGLITQKQNRRLQKTVNIFNFEERAVIAEDKPKKTKGNLKRKFIFLSSKSDDSSESDEDSQEPPLKCQYKVGVSIMRQAYERVLDAGLEGLTQLQLAQLLGVEFYTSRSICKMLRQRKIVREYLEDKGKQRTARYIAIAATGEMDVKYAEEKKKFLENLKENQSNDEPTQEEVPQVPSTSKDDDIPLKRIKLEKEKGLDTEIDKQPSIKDNSEETNTNMDTDNAEHVITEVKVLEGCERRKSLVTFKKNPTLRQLTFANGVFKVLKDKQYVCGYITLSNLVAKEINEPPMDTKALKSFIQKLVTDGHVKIYKIKWPGIQKYSVLICAPHVKATDPLIKAKYKEICMRAVATKKINIKKDHSEEGAPFLSQFSYPRYMKIQKLHEFLMKFAYFEYVPPESHSLPRGFVSIVDFIQEVTVEFVINNLSTMGKTEINQLINESQLPMKLKDVPKHIYESLLGSNTLQNAMRLNLKVLAMLGLIQLVKQPAQSTNSTGVVTYTCLLFFVNRRATILDTTGIWPRTTNEKVTEKSYYFETFEDVTRYWNDVYQISTNTVIELAKRGRRQLKPPQRLEEEVQMYDSGVRYGDGNGPCGFDSCFYMEIPRLWQTFYMRPKQSHIPPKKKITVKLPKVKISKKPKPKPPPPTRPVEKRMRIEKLSRRRVDTIIRWSKHEDMIITMCKAAITIMSPISQPGCLIVRNIVAKDILSIKDPKKTKGVCHRRAMVLESNCSLAHEKQCIINEMKRRRNLIQKYEGLLKKLKIQYSANMTKFINKARIPMMELVWLISKVMRSRTYIRKVPCVAFDMEDFNNHFTITTSIESKTCNMFRTPENVILKETIVLTIMQTIDSDINTEMGKKIYNTFKKYPEKSLRAAVDQLRKSGVIAAKEKIFNNQMHKQDLEDICQSSYKISALYQRKWSNRLNSDYVDNIYTILEAEQTENDVKGSAEINTMYCEMNACNVLDIMSITTPVITAPPGAPMQDENVLTIDTKYKLKTGTLRWKNKSDTIRISDFYKHLNTDKGVKYLSSFPAIDAREIKSNLDTEDPIVLHLNEKAENGATFAELQNVTGFDDAQLIKKLQELEIKKVAKRVGFYENIVVLTKHIQAWTVKIGDKHIVVTPWLTLTGKIRLEIFFKWCGVIMNLIFEKPGSSVVYLSEKCEIVTYRSVQDICMFLEKYECIKLCCVKFQEVDLFSDEDNEPEFSEFNPYEVPEKILAHPLKNSLTKYSYVKKNILDSQSDESLMDKLFKC